MIRIERRDGDVLNVDGVPVARAFYEEWGERFDEYAGNTADPNEILEADIGTINSAMGARSPLSKWEPIMRRPQPWLEAIPVELDLIESAEVDVDLLRAAYGAAIGPYRGASIASKVLHLKRPLLFPILDSLALEVLGEPADDSQNLSVEQRAERATRATERVRKAGRDNLSELREIQTELPGQKSLVRILDALLWSSHPSATIDGFRRSISVALL